MSNKLEDHIDEPIKKAVAGLNLLGFKTYMSCCGFTYDGEKVEKSHLGKAYVYLDSDQVLNSDKLSILLTRIALKSKWRFQICDKFIDFYGDTWSPDHPWSNHKSIHNYEVYLLSINSLIREIRENRHFFQDCEIKDGNHSYLEVSKYWKYKPCESWFVKASDWENIEN